MTEAQPDTPPAESDQHHQHDQLHREREHFFAAARLVAVLTVLSRVLGLIRDRAIVAFGANRNMDVFWTAFRVPNLLRRLFGEGALSAAFVPVFTEVSRAEGWDKARIVLANMTGWLAMILAALLLVAEVLIAAWLLLAARRWDTVLLGQLVMIMLPFMFTICMLALGSAALNCKGHFAYPAFAPIILNISLISAAWYVGRADLAGEWRGLFLLSVGVIAAGVVQLVGVLWLLRSAGLSSVPTFRPMLPEVRRIASMTIPMMIPLGLLQLSAFFDSAYALVMSTNSGARPLYLLGLTIRRPLTEGVVTCLYAANRLYQFPMGILAISLATAVFPLLSRHASDNDMPGLRQTTNRALRLSLFLGIPAGVVLLMLAEPIVLLIYGTGKFTTTAAPGEYSDVQRSAAILRMYCLGMWAYFCNHILLRVFFAVKDTRTPMRIACWLAVTNVTLVVVLVFTPLRGAAFGLATAVTASMNTLLLARMLRNRLGGYLGGRRILRLLLRTCWATGGMAAALVSVRWAVGRWVAVARPELVLVPVSVVVGALAFLGIAAAMRCRELAELRGPAAVDASDGRDTID